MDTDRLAGDFIARTLPKSQWTHEAHLRVGLWHSLHHPRDTALNLLRDRIRAYNLATGVQNTSSEGYHETITRLYLAVIAAFLASVDAARPVDELAQELIERYGDRNLPLRHYTRGRLFSADARLGWLEPDLEPLPGAAIQPCDVVVIGGGPAGSTAAALLARRGYQVIALEKAHHPRFHIGESLLPMNLPIFERLGVLEKVRALGVFKPGADFEADNERGYNTYAFARALGKSPPHAYQVWRQDFDKMLFDHARECGADAREGHEVVQVEQHGPREARLEVNADGGRRYQIQTRYVVDASGRDALLSTKRKLRRKNAEHQSAAIFAHFRGAERRAGEDAGNISIYRFDHGWMWMIPLPDGVMSVGAVCRPDYLKQRKGRTLEFLLETLKSNGGLWQRMRNAELIGNEVRVTGNYSYDSLRMGGPGWVLVGDAFAFLDPVFSSGVYLAMSGAEQAVHVVDSALRKPAVERTLLRKLEKRQRAGMARFSFFIYRFNGPVMQQMFREPRNTWQLEQGVISMLAGDLFDDVRVLSRLTLFKLVYALCGLRKWRRWRAEHKYRLAQARSQFTGGNTPLDGI